VPARGAFAVRGRSLGVLGSARSLGSRLALLDWPDAGSASDPDADPDAVVRIAPTAAGGFEVFFAVLAPMRGVAVVRDAAGRRVEYVNEASELALVDDVTTFAPRGP